MAEEKHVRGAAVEGQTLVKQVYEKIYGNYSNSHGRQGKKWIIC